MAKNETWRRLRVVLAGQEIMATALPQLGKEKECPGNETVTNWGNVVATIRLPRFTLSWSHYLILMRSEIPTSMQRNIHYICPTRLCCKGN